MTTTLRPNRTIRATIKGKMERQSDKGDYLSVQVLRDKMKFPETFNCWDPKQLEHTKLNDMVSLILHCDGVKKDKQDDGQDISYWWSIAGVGDAPTTILVGVADPDPTALVVAEKREIGVSTPATYQEQQARGYDLGMAFNKAVDIVIAEADRGQTAITTEEIRRWRDRLLHEVILAPAGPGHWCYKHQVQRIQSPRTNVWGHVMEDGTACTEVSIPDDYEEA